jgi:hypothetical protein
VWRYQDLYCYKSSRLEFLVSRGTASFLVLVENRSGWCSSYKNLFCSVEGIAFGCYKNIRWEIAYIHKSVRIWHQRWFHIVRNPFSQLNLVKWAFIYHSGYWSHILIWKGAGIAQSVYRLATSFTTGKSKFESQKGLEFPLRHSDRFCGPPSLLSN